MKVTIVLSVLAICCFHQTNALDGEISGCLSEIDTALVGLKTPLDFNELYILLGAPIIQDSEERAKLDERLRKDCTMFVTEGAKILSSSLCGVGVPNFLQSPEAEVESKTLKNFSNLETFGNQMSICIMYGYSPRPQIDGMTCSGKGCSEVSEEPESQVAAGVH